MRIEGLGLNNEEVLDRICEAYGFSQKIQLARHFEIASSSLANRYSRDSISYDFIVHCALETGANLAWLLTGKGSPTTGSMDTDTQNVEKFTLSEEQLASDGTLSIAGKFFGKPLTNPIAVYTDGKLHFIERDASLSDGEWLVDIEGAISIRELTKLPGRKLHVAGGKVPFECGFDDIKALGRVVGVYSEVN
ncbi:TPA: phage repressor protein CI [Enterobacter cloacae]|uniref:phage repressor protein CI n=1 Tax=Enterobacterales TaxID=91347 RepID=UPI0010125CBB|nr:MULTISPECIES: phage repressor protein CI [Enterobacter cloacae complex]EKS6371321.1 helix-turn-helix domain-containing protein [Enterobacter hormaechei]EKS6475454.1 helix-turn-helix domain-containing protein [Enterobacter hormaechei]EKS6483590.1 helix-turn-helix domain-containing protein [Enterobacter hormaechei]EKS6493324.1 helix-turn-helix domain-containing protein [Enterobacter hormaechei]EKT6083978.1 helix-turn-helix domain-containing protein [Enterobacter hormaechei]